MIGPAKFQSRRVFLVHGVLLVAVLVVAYFSARAQYDAMRDQQLEEARIRQQLALRNAGQVVQQSVRKLAGDLTGTNRSTATGTDDDWLTAIVVADSTTGLVLNVEKAPPSAMKLPAFVATAAPATRPTDAAIAMRRGNGELSVEIVAATPQPKRVRVGLLAVDQMLNEISNSQRADNGQISALIDSDGLILAATNGMTSAPIEALIVDRNAAHELSRLVQTNNAASAVVRTDEGDAAVLSVQAIDPLPGTHWFALVWQPNEGQRIRTALQPLLWQLLSGASLIIVAVGIVLGSTTISLYRGRRRIEEMRMAMLRRDLEKARRIQLNWLPKPRRHTEQLEIAAENKAAAHISGDFYNWFDLGEGDNCPTPRTALVIGDVSGHGLPAAFLMATTQMIVRNTLPRLCDPGACLTDLNKQLASLVYNGQFVTIAVLLLDLESGDVEIASAGHSPPLLRRGDEVTEVDLDPDLVCGVDESTQYATHRLRIQSGDTLLLYTDGAIEAHNPLGEQFGVEGLSDAFAAAPTDADGALAYVSHAVALHHGVGEEAEDDLTLVAIRILAGISSEADPSALSAAASI